MKLSLSHLIYKQITAIKRDIYSGKAWDGREEADGSEDEKMREKWVESMENRVREKFAGIKKKIRKRR